MQSWPVVVSAAEKIRSDRKQCRRLGTAGLKKYSVQTAPHVLEEITDSNLIDDGLLQ